MSAGIDDQVGDIGGSYELAVNSPEAVAQILYRIRPEGQDPTIPLIQRGYDFALATLASVADTQGWENVEEGLRLYKEMLEQEGEEEPS